MIKFVTDFFAAPNRITKLETRMNTMSQIVEQLKEVVTGLKALVVSEREQVNTKLDTVATEVAELKAKIEDLTTTPEPDFTEVFGLLETLAADIEGIYVEPQAELPEVKEPEAETPVEPAEPFEDPETEVEADPQF